MILDHDRLYLNTLDEPSYVIACNLLELLEHDLHIHVLIIGSIPNQSFVGVLHLL